MANQHTTVSVLDSHITISPANVQLTHSLFYPCTVRIPGLLPINSQKTYCSAHVQSLSPLYFPSLVSTRYIMSISRQNTTSPSHVTISPAHFHSQCHLSSQCPVRILALLPMLSQYTLLLKFSQFTTSPTQIHSEYYHLFCSCPISSLSPIRITEYGHTTLSIQLQR